MRIDIIAGARPNFMKIAPIIRQIEKRKKEGGPLSYRLVHTGQHYDYNMSGSFFEQLGIPKPDVNLEVGSGTQAEQTASIMTRYESLLMKQGADLCLVVGDVTSTMACAIVAKKMMIPVAHVEAGIRSGDISMPEEVNRIVTDSLTDFFFTTSKYANENLRLSGVSEDRIHFVGNTMIDTLLAHRSEFRKPRVWDQFGLQEKRYLVLTMHRPSNVDEEETLRRWMEQITGKINGMPIVFPAHPRTAQVLQRAGIEPEGLQIVDPLGYLEFNFLVERSLAVITDSGGITEEATVMGVPCMTLRDSTERPETVEVGTNELIGTDPEAIGPALERLFSGEWKEGEIPEKWDGKTAERIVKVIELKAQSSKLKGESS